MAYANSTLADLQNISDSQDAKKATLDATNYAETAARVAAIAWLLSALGTSLFLDSQGDLVTSPTDKMQAQVWG